jgi:hypothetical protein
VSTVRLFAIAVVLGALTFFVAENFNTVEVRVFTLRRHTRLAYALLAAAVLGFVAGWVARRLRDR